MTRGTPGRVDRRAGPRARAALAVAGAVLVLAGLAGCGGSVARLRAICTAVTTGTAALAPYDPAHPVSALQFALGRFTLVERAVSTVREVGLPATDAAALRRGWLNPATASLATWDVRLETLRVAVDAGEPARIAAAVPPAFAVGTDGVDGTTLRDAGLAACATAFTAPAGAPATAG